MPLRPRTPHTSPIRRLLLSLVLLTQVACGTIANGPMQRIEVDSFPSGAEVHLDECGPFATKGPVTTPARVLVHRHAGACRITLAMPGHAPKTVQLERNWTLAPYGRAMAGWCSGDDGRNCNSLTDIVVAGSVGAIFFVPSLLVDTASGGLFEQEPKFVAARFDEK